MAITKTLCSWIIEGVKSTSGNTMTFWKTNFNMPVPCLYDGTSDWNAGWMCTRYNDIGFTSQSLAAFYPGYEVALADSIHRWSVSGGDCLNGLICETLTWYRGVTCIGGYSGPRCVNISSSSGTTTCTWSEMMTNTGIAAWEICGDGTYCTVSQATCVSGNDASIAACTICLDFGNVPSTGQCSAALTGSIWVEGIDLHYINANKWEHVMIGSDNGLASAQCGAIWIDNSHYLHWIGCDCHDYSATWKICQFCSTFSNGAPVNPSPGAGYKGAIWVDNQFGSTHLAYIGCDGNKYLTGGANYPYLAPY